MKQHKASKAKLETYTTQQAASEPFIAVMRELVRAYQAFTAYDALHIRELKLTQPQFDVIATLGNTVGMTFKEIGEKTLITKGTLTGVIDRLEKKKLVKRVMQHDDRRCTTVTLTPAGQSMFEKIFPGHIAYLKERFDRLSPDKMDAAKMMLKTLRTIF